MLDWNRTVLLIRKVREWDCLDVWNGKKITQTR